MDELTEMFRKLKLPKTPPKPKKKIPKKKKSSPKPLRFLLAEKERIKRIKLEEKELERKKKEVIEDFKRKKKEAKKIKKKSPSKPKKKTPPKQKSEKKKSPPKKKSPEKKKSPQELKKKMKSIDFNQYIDSLLKEYKNEKAIKNYFRKIELMNKTDYHTNINKYVKIFREENLGQYIDKTILIPNIEVNKNNTLKKRYISDINKGLPHYRKLPEKFLIFDLFTINRVLYSGAIESYLFIELEDFYVSVGLLRNDTNLNIRFSLKYDAIIYLKDQIKRGNYPLKI